MIDDGTARPGPLAEEGRWREEVEEFGNARIDQPQVEEDAAAWAETQAPASGDELSAHLPDWAKPILREREAYEREQKTQRAAEFRPVDGRMWEEGGDSAGGLRDFTPEEIADDYSLPLESVVAELEEIGVPAAKLEPPWRPRLGGSDDTSCFDYFEDDSIDGKRGSGGEEPTRPFGSRALGALFSLRLPRSFSSLGHLV